MKTIAIIGGSQESTFKKLGKRYNCNVLFHDGKVGGKGNKKIFKNIIQKSDIVVILLGACGHITMESVKEISKKLNKQIIFHRGFGASGAIQLCVEKLNIAS